MLMDSVERRESVVFDLSGADRTAILGGIETLPADVENSKDKSIGQYDSSEWDCNEGYSSKKSDGS